MAEQINSLIITRKSERFWMMSVNGNLLPDAESAYSGSLRGNYITTKSLSGAPVAVNVYFTAIDYIDELDSANNLTNPSTAQEMMGHLVNQGFYNGIDGGSSGGVDTFKQLLDVNLPGGFFGKNGYIIRIDDNGQFLIATPPTTGKFVSLEDWLGGNLQPNMYILTSSQVDGDGNAIGLIQSNIETIVNSPTASGQYATTDKGYIESGTSEPYTYTANLETYGLEAGDFRTIVSLADGKKYELRYAGGDPNDLASYEIIGWKKIAIPGEPSYIP